MSTIVSLLALTAVLQSPAAPPFVNQTFKEILSRVVERDPGSGAVMAVRPKADSPGPLEMRLTLEIRRSGLFNARRRK